MPLRAAAVVVLFFFTVSVNARAFAADEYAINPPLTTEAASLGLLEELKNSLHQNINRQDLIQIAREIAAGLSASDTQITQEAFLSLKGQVDEILVNGEFTPQEKSEIRKALNGINAKDADWTNIRKILAAQAASLGEDDANPPVPDENETVSEKLKPVLESRRGLLVSEDADAVDQALAHEAKRRGVEYVRLSIKHPRELDRLMTGFRIKNGDVEILRGRVPKIIEDGGILYIDYDGSSAHLMEQFNSLFDEEPFFEGREVSENLIIVGSIGKENFAGTDSTFRSRFAKTLHWKRKSKDLLADISEAPDGLEAVEVDLFSSPHFRDELVGTVCLDEDGYLRVREGALLCAIRQNRAIVIKGDSWNDSGFLRFIRGVMLHKKVYFNGEEIAVPEGFRIYKGTSDYRDGVRKKRIIDSSESEMEKEKLWVITAANQDILFSRTHVSGSGKLTQLAGLLDLKKLKIRIEGKLPEWVWHKIMHSPHEIEIQLSGGAKVPAIYSSFKSEKLNKQKPETKRKSWGDVRNEKTVYIETEDIGFARTSIKDDLEGEILVFPVTPGTGMEDLVASIEVETSGVGKREFSTDVKEVLEALKRGATVILESIESNPTLIAELATLLCEEPYVMENGVRLDVEDIPGRLIMIGKPRKLYSVSAENFVEMSPGDEAMAELLGNKYPKKFSQDTFAKILRLKKILETIPAPSLSGLYQAESNLSFDRISILYAFDGGWLDAFETVFIPFYTEVPEVAAFIRTMVRLIFEVDAEQQKKNTIAGRRLRSILDRMSPRSGWMESFWQLADTLSLDLLRSCGVGEDYLDPNSAEVFGTIRKALVKHYANERDRAQCFRYRFRFSDEVDLEGAAHIDDAIRLGEENWQQRKQRIVKLLGRHKALFFRGSPGTGKSHIAREIASEMGYDPSDIVGPISVGADTGTDDVVAKSVFEDGKTSLRQEAVARWIPAGNDGDDALFSRPGRLFIVDEANLTKPEFWNFLRSFFAEDPAERYVFVGGRKRWFNDEDRIIFTGNQETLVGREVQELFSDFVITVNFAPFGKEFLRDRLKEYVHAAKSEKDKLVDLMLEIHFVFQEMNSGFVFSLRDMQEFAARVNVFLGRDWESEDIVFTAWKQYSGSFSPAEKEALAHILAKKFGVNVLERVKKETDDIRSKETMGYKGEGVILVDSSARMLSSVEDFLKMREARLRKESLLQGKRGMFFEGPSGRGKDLLLAAVLKRNGFEDAKKASGDTSGTKKFYRVNASSRTHELEQVIEKARREGSVVVISEMNLLPSAFLEGKLNDLLTGRAHTGFALFATMNSLDFSGRRKLSTAFQNRTIYERIGGYTQDELRQLALGAKVAIHKKHTKFVVKAHAWIRENVERPNQKPTVRDILNTLRLIRQEGISPREAVEKIYGPFYISTALGGKALPSDEELDNFEEKRAVDNIEVMRLISGYLVGRSTKIKMDPVTNQGGYYSFADDSIILSTKNPLEYQLVTLDHEAGHGRFTREFAGISPALSSDKFFWFYVWLEDMRQERAMREYFPFSELGGVEASDVGFVPAVKLLDMEYLYKMTPQDLFKLLLSSYARGLITKPDVADLSEVMEGLYPVNIASYALRHLETAKKIYECIPEDLGEEEILFRQFRALKLMHTIRDDYLEIAELQVSKEETAIEESEGDLRMSVENAKRKVQDSDLPVNIAKGKGIPAQAKLKDFDPEEKARRIAEVKERLRKEKEKAMARSREELVKELELMESDLERPSLLSRERLDEMRAQIENRHHPVSLVAKLEQLGDDELSRRARKIRDEIGRIIEKKEKAMGEAADAFGGGVRQRGSWNDINSVMEGALRTWSGRGARTGAGDAIIRARYPTARAHEESAKRKAVSIEKEKPKPEKRPLAVREKSEITRKLARTSERESSLLDEAVRDFIKSRMDIERVYGQEGVLDVERFIAGNPTMAFYRSGGVEEKAQKEIVMSGRMGRDGWNVILEEIISVLLEKGFRFTVYTSENSYVEGIRTLSDFKKILASSGDVRREKVVEDLSSRKRREDYEYVTVRELQEKVEGIYLYGALKDALENKSGEKEEEEVKADEENAGQLSFAEQVERAKEFLRENKIDEDRLTVDEERQALELSLNGTAVEDISALGGLVALEALSLSDTCVSDISALGGLTNLKRLLLVRTKVSDISALGDLINLEKLVLKGSYVRDISALSGLVALKELSLGHMQVRDISALDGLTSLKKLDLRETQVRDISALGGLAALEALELDGTQVSDISALGGLTNLKRLLLERTKVSDISALGDLINLEKLVLKGSYVRDISALSGLVALKELSLGYMQVRDISALGDLTNLENLSLWDTQVRDISALGGLVALKELSLGCTQVSDISALGGLAALEDLNLDGTQVSDISALSGLAALKRLNLYRTAVEDISALGGLVALKELSLFGTQVRDISALGGLAALKVLELRYTQVSDVRIYKLFRASPNRENLRVINKDGRTIRYSDVPDEYRPVPALSFAEQVERAKEFLRENGIDGDRLTVDEERQTLELDLRETQVRDISALGDLTNLENLSIWDTQVRDISALGGLVALKELSLGCTQVSDISALGGLVNLKLLDLNNTSVSDINALSGLVNLEVLGLGSTFVDDISALKDLVNLKNLRISIRTISNISALKGLVNLEWLFLDGAPVENISALSGLVNLELLDLSRTAVEDISALGGLTNLKGLRLDRTKVSDISALDGLVALKELNLSGTQVSDISALGGLVNLAKLNLSQTAVEDISALGDFVALESLDLADTQVSDISALRGLVNLKSLSLWKTQVRDISALGDLTNLENLSLWGTQVRDISALGGLVALKKLSLRGTQVSDGQIYELFRDSANREQLEVKNKEGQKITYADVPDEYKEAKIEKKDEDLPAPDILIKVANALRDPGAALRRAKDIFKLEAGADDFNKALKILHGNSKLSKECGDAVREAIEAASLGSGEGSTKMRRHAARKELAAFIGNVIRFTDRFVAERERLLLAETARVRVKNIKSILLGKENRRKMESAILLGA